MRLDKIIPSWSELQAPSCTCSLCGKVAFYFVEGKGFCRDHRQESITAQRSMFDEFFQM